MSAESAHTLSVVYCAKQKWQRGKLHSRHTRVGSSTLFIGTGRLQTKICRTRIRHVANASFANYRRCEIRSESSSRKRARAPASKALSEALRLRATYNTTRANHSPNSPRHLNKNSSLENIGVHAKHHGNPDEQQTPTSFLPPQNWANLEPAHGRIYGT